MESGKGSAGFGKTVKHPEKNAFAQVYTIVGDKPRALFMHMEAVEQLDGTQSSHIDRRFSTEVLEDSPIQRDRVIQR